MEKKTPDIRLSDEGKSERERKAGGFWLGFLSRLGGGALSGSGWSGAGSVALGGGLLATKAGIVGVALVGVTAAGGIGLVGYRLFGPGPQDRIGAPYSVFPARPKTAETAAGPVGGGKDSASLNRLSQANAGSDYGQQAREAAEAANKAQAEADAKKADAEKQSASVGNAQNNNAAPGGKPGSLFSAKIGALSTIGAGSGGASTAKPSMPAEAAALVAKAATGGLNSPAAPRASADSGRRSLSPRRFGTAFRQAGQVRRDQSGAQSSQAAGTTYDGGGGGGAIGANSAVPEGAAGVTSGGGGRSNSDPTPAAGPGERFPPPPTLGQLNVTPWQKAINIAAILVAIAAVVLFAAARFAKDVWIKNALAALAAILGMAIIAIGAMIGGGAYGQTAQGNMFVLAGGFIIAAAAASYFLPAEGKVGMIHAIMLISGAAAVGAALWGYLSPKKVYPSSDFDGGKPPDIGHSASYRHPSEKYLERFLV